MRLRYLISKEGIAHNLVIKEYAMLDEVPRKTNGMPPIKDNYTFVYQEKYEGDMINSSISRGINDLTATLRTDQLFPVGIFAQKIAASVIEMFQTSENCSTELFFDDYDQF